jgi:hypothetical protein
MSCSALAGKRAVRISIQPSKSASRFIDEYINKYYFFVKIGFKIGFGSE